MKKLGQIVLVFLLSVGMFTGCGTSYKADESTVFVPVSYTHLTLPTIA